jgi:hypothetical protein
MKHWRDEATGCLFNRARLSRALELLELVYSRLVEKPSDRFDGLLAKLRYASELLAIRLEISL